MATAYTGHVVLEHLFCSRATYKQEVTPPAREASAPRQVGEEFSLSISLAHRDRGAERVEVELGVKVEPDLEHNQPYFVEAAFVGRFRLVNLPEGLSREVLAKRNAGAILFPFIREAIASLTSRGSFGPLLLPPVNVVAMLERSEAEKSGKPRGKRQRRTPAS